MKVDFTNGIKSLPVRSVDNSGRVENTCFFSPKRCHWSSRYDIWLIPNIFKLSKKFPTGPIEWTPKPEYLIALAAYLGVLWDSVPFNFWWKLDLIGRIGSQFAKSIKPNFEDQFIPFRNDTSPSHSWEPNVHGKSRYSTPQAEQKRRRQVGAEAAKTSGLAPSKVSCSPPVRWGLLEFM